MSFSFSAAGTPDEVSGSLQHYIEENVHYDGLGKEVAKVLAAEFSDRVSPEHNGRRFRYSVSASGHSSTLVPHGTDLLSLSVTVTGEWQDVPESREEDHES